jgi:hypothetical protein
LTAFELQEVPTKPVDAPAGPISPDPSWSPLERWIWEKLQAGELANVDDYEDDNGPLPPADPKKPEDWQDGRRRLASRFSRGRSATRALPQQIAPQGDAYRRRVVQ